MKKISPKIISLFYKKEFKLFSTGGEKTRFLTPLFTTIQLIAEQDVKSQIQKKYFFELYMEIIRIQKMTKLTLYKMDISYLQKLIYAHVSGNMYPLARENYSEIEFLSLLSYIDTEKKNEFIKKILKQLDHEDKLIENGNYYKKELH